MKNSYNENKKLYNQRPEEKAKRAAKFKEYLARPGVKEMYRKWRESPQRKEQLRRNELKRKYGMSLEEFNQMVKDQKGTCLICLKVPKKRLVIDHCHKTGKVRGLLCDPCNVALGFLEDNVEFLLRAVNYLK